MIHVFVGEDMQKARQMARKEFDSARKDDPSASVSRFNDLSFDMALATEALHAENLFGGGNILYFDAILDHPEGESFYRTILKESGHTVIIRETAPSKDLLAFFERTGRVETFALAKKIEKRENSFALADALGARDKKIAWVEFEKVMRRGAAMEEVHGTVFWAFKTMYIVATVTHTEAIAMGIKEFTYKNYLNYSRKYLIPELKEKLNELKEMYHKAHRGEGDFEVLMEQFILNL